MKILNADDMLKNTLAMKEQFDAIEINGIIKYINDMAEEGDFVNVVRCKDCKGCFKKDDYEYWCTRISPNFLVPPDGYCNRGSKKIKRKIYRKSNRKMLLRRSVGVGKYIK